MKQLLLIFLACWIILDEVGAYSFLGFQFGDETARIPRGIVKKSNEKQWQK
jgi:hypothetical protein